MAYNPQPQTVGNYGLLEGLSEGANSFLNAYQTTKNINYQRNLQNLVSGVQQDPNTGQLDYTPAKKLEIQSQAAHAQGLLDQSNPTSTFSTQMATRRGALAHAGNPNIPENSFEGLPDTGQKELEGLAKPDISGQFGLLGKQQMAQVIQNRSDQSMAQRQQRNQMSANTQYSKEMGGTEAQLLSANRVNALIQGIDAGKLQSTPQLKSDLSAALAQMLNAGKPATVYGMSNQEFDSAYGRAQRGMQFLTGTTGNSMTQPQLDQLKKDVNALAGEYQKQREVKYNAFKQGLPSQVTGGLDQRYQTFTGGVGQDMNKGMMKDGHPQDSEAVQWAKANPKDPRAAAILKANGM